jgi:hypothetical protein
VRAAQTGSAFVARRSRDLDLIFALQYERTVNRDNTVSIQNLRLQIEAVRWRGTLAGCSVNVRQHLDETFTPDPWAAPAGPLQRPRGGLGRQQNAARTGCGKAAWWKSPSPDFPTSLGNPAKSAGFPLSHNSDGCWLFNSNRTCHVLRKPDILTC